MIQARAVIVNSRGLHARPATMLAKRAARHKSTITIRKGRRNADAASVASLLMLVASQHSELTVEASGEDAEAAVADILELIAGGFNDDAVDNNPQLPAAPAVPRGENTTGNAAMQKIYGTGVGDTMASGEARIRMPGESDVPRYRINAAQTAAECARFEKALADTRAELDALGKRARQLPGAAEIAPFIDLYRNLLDDPEICIKPREIIRRRRINGEWALKERVDLIRANFRRIEDEYFRERGRDIDHVMRRLLAAMANGGKAKTTAPEILIAEDLDPASVINLRQAGCRGFVTETGGGMSHTAIVARSLGIPALVGAAGVLAAAQDGDMIIIDPGQDVAIIRPDDNALARAKKAAKKPGKTRAKTKTGGVMTLDGEKILLETNIEFPGEVGDALRFGADGIGLFRTEFVFLNRSAPPSEDEQFEIYRDVLRRTSPLPVVFRTLDLGADKINTPESRRNSASGNANPMTSPLGLRAIRYCLAAPELFLDQLRALLRAFAETGTGAGKILLPMLSAPAELLQTATLINHAREQLRALRKLDAPSPQLGAMIEVPAAVFVMRAFARHLGFFSVGSNDLVQYTLAVDRGDEKLAALSDPLHPAILRLLAMTTDNARRANKPVTLCGEIAGDPALTPLLLALGFRRLSMNVSQIARVRDVIGGENINDLAATRRRLLTAQTPEAARAFAESEAQKRDGRNKSNKRTAA